MTEMANKTITVIILSYQLWFRGFKVRSCGRSVVVRIVFGHTAEKIAKTAIGTPFYFEYM